MEGTELPSTYLLVLTYYLLGQPLQKSLIGVSQAHETCTWNLHRIERSSSLFGASFFYQELAHSADQSDCMILFTCIGFSVTVK